MTGKFASAFPLVALLAVAVIAQSPPPAPQATQPPAQPAPQKSISSMLGVYVMPSAGQTPEQTSADESACYTWAVQNSGVDPATLGQQVEEEIKKGQEQAKNVGKGAGVKGAAGGAATGALMGAIVDDAGTGAALGAVGGALAGRAQARQAKKQAQQQVEQQAHQAAAGKMNEFKKAFSLCLESKKYNVKY